MQSTILAGHWHIFRRGTNQRTLILLHGTGGNEAEMLNLGRQLDAQANLLSIRGNVNEYGMNRYFKRIAEGVYDWDDLAVRTEALAAFVHQASRQYDFDVSQTVIIGYSNGANIATNILLHEPSTFRRLVLLRPLFPTDQVKPVDMTDCHILLLSGQQDDLIPVDQAERLAGFLDKCHAEVEFVLRPVGHGLEDFDIVLVRQWLSKTSS